VPGTPPQWCDSRGLPTAPSAELAASTMRSGSGRPTLWPSMLQIACYLPTLGCVATDDSRPTALPTPGDILRQTRADSRPDSPSWLTSSSCAACCYQFHDKQTPPAVLGRSASQQDGRLASMRRLRPHNRNQSLTYNLGSQTWSLRRQARCRVASLGDSGTHDAYAKTADGVAAGGLSFTLWPACQQNCTAGCLLEQR
jgi:hypothetical protein